MKDEVVNWKSLLFLITIFSFLALLFWQAPWINMWWVLVFSSILWLGLEVYQKKGDVKKGMQIGLFLVVFDFVVQNIGKMMGLWESYKSSFMVMAVPIEVMLICCIGGTAWALYLPKKFNLVHTVCDILIFSFFGSLGEFLLINGGLLKYSGGWTSIHAFFAYMVTWIILHTLKYKVIRM